MKLERHQAGTRDLGLGHRRRTKCSWGLVAEAHPSMQAGQVRPETVAAGARPGGSWATDGV